MASMSVISTAAGTLLSTRKNQQLLHSLGFSPVPSQTTSSRRSSFTTPRCMADKKADREKVTSTAASRGSNNIPSPPPPSKPKVSTKFTDLLAFSGPAPERINGRLAMVGFVAAIAVELSKGQDLMSQISGGGLSWFVATSLLLSAASLVPLFKGVRAETETNGLMNANAELWNGRFAMLGLVALAFTEYVKGTTLI